MRRDRRFFAGLVGVAAVVSYLVWTGIQATMTFYVTPSELFARLSENPEIVGRGIRVSGHVLPGSHEQESGAILHRFTVLDPLDASIHLTVEFAHPLPDTFTDAEEMLTEVVMEGRYREDGIFEATQVLTKCGSRYESIPEEPEAMRSAGTGAEGGVEG